MSSPPFWKSWIWRKFSKKESRGLREVSKMVRLFLTEPAIPSLPYSLEGILSNPQKFPIVLLGTYSRHYYHNMISIESILIRTAGTVCAVVAPGTFAKIMAEFGEMEGVLAAETIVKTTRGRFASKQLVRTIDRAKATARKRNQ